MISIQINWWNLQAIAKEKPENYAILREAQKTLPPLEDILANKGYASFDAFVNDVDQLPDWVIESATFKPIKQLKFMVDGHVSTVAVKDALALAQVHLPGNELLRIHEVQVQEDCCTDMLQQQLKAGWRIIAVCPQPSRRPDYILGRI